jgi:hypothetical protein
MTESDAALLITQTEPRLSEEQGFAERQRRFGARVYCPSDGVGLEVWTGDRYVTVEFRKDEAAELARRLLRAANYVPPRTPAPHHLRVVI